MQYIEFADQDNLAEQIEALEQLEQLEKIEGVQNLQNLKDSKKLQKLSLKSSSGRVIQRKLSNKLSDITEAIKDRFNRSNSDYEATSKCDLEKNDKKPSNLS